MSSLRRQPIQDRSKQRFERIVEAATDVFAEVGYDAATTEAIAEVANWFNADSVNRFMEIRNISPTVVPGSATPFSFNTKIAGRWYTRTDGEQGGNTTIVLGCKAFYDASGLGYTYLGTVVNGRSAL